MSSPVPIGDLSQWLSQSVIDIFDTMFTLAAQPGPVPAFAEGKPLILAAIGFAGDANVDVVLQTPADAAARLASNILGMPVQELDEDMVNDVVGELANMVVGSVKSRVSDMGVSCVMTIPTIFRCTQCRTASSGTSERRSLGFRYGNDDLLVEVALKTPKK
jgi:chemotaxis protein CheX